MTVISSASMPRGAIGKHTKLRLSYAVHLTYIGGSLQQESSLTVASSAPASHQGAGKGVIHDSC